MTDSINSTFVFASFAIIFSAVIWGFWLNIIGVIVVACRPNNNSNNN